MEETENVELKKSTSELKEGVISIASILNKHRKGKLYFGIKDNGNVVGQTIGKTTLKEVSKTISENIEPKIYPKVKKVKIEKKDCISVEFSGVNVPYFAYGRGYIRVGEEDRQLSAKELGEMFRRKDADKNRWDIQVCEEAELEDISVTKLKTYLEKAKLKYDSVENTLEKLDLIKDGKILNAALILFGKKPTKFFPNAKLRCAVFGSERTHPTIDMHDFEGDLFELIDTAEKYIMRNINIGMKLDGLRRVDVPEINQKAFREAIINAFCHRDYNKYDPIHVAIFKNRVEVRSPGLLFRNLTIEKIMKENISRRRNELIADLFHRIELIEKWGRGIGLILSKEPNTRFEEIVGEFHTVFKRKSSGKGEIIKKVETPYEITDNQMRILEEMKKNIEVTTIELSKIIGISRRKILANIKKLKEKELIRRMGSRKKGYWYIIKIPVKKKKGSL